MRHPHTLFTRIQTMVKDDKGATMVEYALMVAFIAMVAFAAVVTFGTNLNDTFVSFAGLFR